MPAAPAMGASVFDVVNRFVFAACFHQFVNGPCGRQRNSNSVTDSGGNR